MTTKKRIFISPLDWGLGHATRCIPIIKEFQRQGAEVIIGADRDTYDLLVSEFPSNAYIKFPGYDIKYSKKGNMFWQMAKMSPKIIGRISLENKYLKQIITSHNIDGVISDNRFGLFNSTIPTAFITHQLFIRSPFGKGLINKINRFFIKKYSECWIPDFADKELALSGELSHKGNIPDNTKFIGPLSRFSNLAKSNSLKYDVLVLISGPEPQRTIFEEMILSQLKSTSLKALVVLGKPGISIAKEQGSVAIVNHLHSVEMRKAILASKLVISRPGYTTIMDLATLGKRGIFIPTPGQTEQKYLAKHHNGLGNCVWSKQKAFKIIDLIAEAEEIKGFDVLSKNKLLETVVKDFLNKV